MDATTIITQIFLPISLAIIMFGMGLTLVISDFTRLFSYPKEIFIGLFNQLVFLPLIGFLIILLFDLDSTMAIGIMILSLCPWRSHQQFNYTSFQRKYWSFCYFNCFSKLDYCFHNPYYII